MSDSHTTATPETKNATPTAHPPVRENQQVVEAEVEQGAIAEQRVMRAVGGGSPATPPQQFAGALAGMEGRSQAGMLRQLQRSYGNSYVGAVIQRKADGDGTCDECEKKEKEIQRKGEGDVSSVPDGFEATMQRSGTGQPLDEGTRSFMESRFGQDFGDVRVHTDSASEEAAESILAQAFTTNRAIYFGRGRFQPQTKEGQKLIAHELTHIVQQTSGIQRRLVVDQPESTYEREAETVASQIVDGHWNMGFQATSNNGISINCVQRQPSPGATSEGSVTDAITKGDSSIVSSLVPEQLAKATPEQKIQMIDILLDKGTFFEKAKIPSIWDSFGKGIEKVANTHADCWKRSFNTAGEHMRTSKEVRGLQRIFYLDVQDVAKGYLDQNELYCKTELQRLGLTETGEIIVGPPTAEQSAQLKATQSDATKLVADQDALRDLRKVMCGYQRTIVSPGSPGGTDVKPEYLDEMMPFDPDLPPPLEPKPDDGMKSWKEVKKIYDNLNSLIQARVSANPSLFVLIRNAHEDSSKSMKVAQGSREDALSTLGTELHEVLINIQKTRPMLATLASDLQPIQQQLLSGVVTSPTAMSRNWEANPFFATLGHDIVEQSKPGPWWQTLGLATAELAAWVVAGMATGGVAIGVGMAANSAAQVALNEGKAQAFSAASQTNVTASTALVSDGQVKEAEAAVIESAAFALLDTVLAVGAFRGALRNVFHYEQEAAKAAKNAAMLAEKNIAREEAKDAAKEARRIANEAKSSADKAREAATAATKEEAVRAEEEVRRAEKEAANADRSAQDVEASAGETVGSGKAHPEPHKVGEHEVKVRGNWVTRCSEPPCAELAHSVAERARAGVEKLATTKLGGRAEELGSRLQASKRRAEALAERARSELTSTTDRLATETRLQNEGALIEADVQAVERQIELEVQAAQNQFGAQWGEMVKQNVKGRINLTTERATIGGKTPNDLVKKLVGLSEQADQLAKSAAEFEKPKHLRKGNLTEIDLSVKWQNLDKELEGLEREERVRRDLRELGGKSLGESDAEMRKNLGIQNVGGQPAASPDIGIDMGSGTLLLAESKGSEIEHALEQFASAMNGDKAKQFHNFDLQIHMKPLAFEELIQGRNAQGFRARKVGNEWFLVGGRDKVKNFPVRVFPG
jgi:Domain of unknown function (DUF4157)